MISDYNTLKGEKKRVVLAVIITGIIIGSVYTIVKSLYSNVDDGIKVEQNIKNIPIK
jgi:hypothetical protein